MLSRSFFLQSTSSVSLIIAAVLVGSADPAHAVIYAQPPAIDFNAPPVFKKTAAAPVAKHAQAAPKAVAPAKVIATPTKVAATPAKPVPKTQPTAQTAQIVTPVVPASTPPVSTGATVDWTGPYIGVNWGLASGTAEWSKPTGVLARPELTPRFPASAEETGIFGGLTAGWNYQTGSLVGGIEADGSGSFINSNAVCGGVRGEGGLQTFCSSSVDALGSLSLRGGYAAGPVLIYAKAGVAAASETRKQGYFALFAPNAVHVRSRDTLIGSTFGVGVEYALTSAFSAKAEYNYYRFGNKTHHGVDQYGYDYGATVGHNINLLKFGINYRVGADPAGRVDPSLLVAKDLSGEIGTRLGGSNGSFEKRLYDPYDRSQLNSRLTWKDQGSLTSETYARLEHSSGVYAKAMLGGTSLTNSQMYDEDFPAALGYYSKTKSTSQDGNGLYGTFDIGYAVLDTGRYKLSPFVGYSHYEQNQKAYGCADMGQVAFFPCEYFVAKDQLVLSQSERWRSLRLGVGGSAALSDRVTLAVEGAWLPYSSLNATDNHWLRPDINPMKETGSGRGGFQLEAVLSYKIDERLSVGLGARYWHFEAKGNTQFPGNLPSSPEKMKSVRTPIFAQLAYSFGK